AIYFQYYWLIIPTPRPAVTAASPATTITVRRSTGSDFGPGPAANQDWSHGPCYGSRGTFFAYVTGDRKADCILVNDDTISVRLSTGAALVRTRTGRMGHAMGTAEHYSLMYGDGRASIIVVNG